MLVLALTHFLVHQIVVVDLQTEVNYMVDQALLGVHVGMYLVITQVFQTHGILQLVMVILPVLGVLELLRVVLRYSIIKIMLLKQL